MKNNAILRAFRDLFGRMGIVTLGYIVSFILVMAILQFVFKEKGIDVPVTLTVVGNFSNRMYLLTMGIICPLVYLPHYVAAGVTRRQFAVGICAAAALLSLCFAVLCAPRWLAAGEFTPLGFLTSVVYGTLHFVVGWTSAVGFQMMRLLPVVIGLSCASAMCVGLWFLADLTAPLWAHLAISVCALCLVGFALLRAVERIAMRC